MDSPGIELESWVIRHTDTVRTVRGLLGDLVDATIQSIGDTGTHCVDSPGIEQY